MRKTSHFSIAPMRKSTKLTTTVGSSSRDTSSMAIRTAATPSPSLPIALFGLEPMAQSPALLVIRFMKFAGCRTLATYAIIYGFGCDTPVPNRAIILHGLPTPHGPLTKCIHTTSSSPTSCLTSSATSKNGKKTLGRRRRTFLADWPR